MKSSKASQESSKASQVMRWVGYGTAILSLVAGIGAIGKTVLDRLETRRKIDALIASESVQLKGHDYESAWRSLEQASQADPGSARVHAAQEALAMEWLENIHAGKNESFSGIVEKLEPVLTRGVGSTQSQSQQADLLAHVGWSYFLRSREGNFGLDPASAYAEAVKRDANNPYAQAMWGHWILWNRGPLADAEQHFSSALASNRQRAYVRQLQLAALMNGGEPCEGEIIRVANAIRKEQGVPDLETQHRVFSIYYFKLLHPDAATTRFINAVPAAEHVATFRWLFDGYAARGVLASLAWAGLAFLPALTSFFGVAAPPLRLALFWPLGAPFLWVVPFFEEATCAPCSAWGIPAGKSRSGDVQRGT